MSKDINKDELVEFQATGENSMAADPVAKASNKRLADKTEGEKANPLQGLAKYEILANIMQAAAKMNKGALASISAKMSEEVEGLEARKTSDIIMEDMKELFGADLSDEFVTKASTIFEAAVATKVQAEIVRLEEQFEAQLEEKTETHLAEMTEKVDQYISYIAEEWMTENTLTVESGLRAEMAESFLTGLKSLFEDHYVDIPEDKEEVVESLALKIEELEGKLNEEIDSKVAMRRAIEEMKAQQILADLSEGLADTQKEKLRSLAENIEYTDNDEFKAKLETLKETYFTKTSEKRAVEDQLITDEVETLSEQTVDPRVAGYVNAIARTVKK